MPLYKYFTPFKCPTAPVRGRWGEKGGETDTPFRLPRLEPERKETISVFFGGKSCYQFYFLMKVENLVTTHASEVVIKWNFRAAMPHLPWLKNH